MSTLGQQWMAAMSDGIVNLDTDFARLIGFTSDIFDGYLWRDGDRVVISFIASKQPGRGHFSALMKSIKDQGLRVAVPTPFPQMVKILTAKGFVPHDVYDEEMETVVEVWEERRATDN